MARSTRDPLDVAPFLRWADERIAAITRDLGSEVGLKRDTNLAGDHNPIERFVMSLGWAPESGLRTLHRWRHEQRRAARATIEDALDHADVGVWEIYPDLPERRLRPLGTGRRMTDAQILAAHVVYTRGKLTISDLAALVWESFGYASVDSASMALTLGFRSLALPTRQCIATTTLGARCKHAPATGLDVCETHGDGANRPCDAGGRAAGIASAARGWHPDGALLNRAARLHATGLPWSAVAAQLQPLTPLKSSEYLTAIFRREAIEEGTPS